MVLFMSLWISFCLLLHLMVVASNMLFRFTLCRHTNCFYAFYAVRVWFGLANRDKKEK